MERPPTPPFQLRVFLLMSPHHIRLTTRRLSFALLPFVLPAVERSISPRKCISLRELQTTRRIPTVCSPSTSHLSWKNRCILSPLPRSLSVSLNKNLSLAPGQPRSPPSAPTRNAPSSSLQSLLSVSLYMPIFGHPISARLPARFLRRR